MECFHSVAESANPILWRGKMNRLLAGHILIMAFVLLCVPVYISAQNDIDPESETLRGLEGVMVIVEELSPDIVADGVTEAMIKSAAEKRLKAAGIEVLTEEKMLDTPGFPFLYINLNSIKLPGGGGYIYSIKTELYQVVALIRDTENICFASTWESSMVGILSESQVKTVVDTVLELVDEFAEDYVAVNKSVVAPYNARFPIPSYDASFEAQAKGGFDLENYLQPVSWLEYVNSMQGISSSLFVDKTQEPSGGLEPFYM